VKNSADFATVVKDKVAAKSTKAPDRKDNIYDIFINIKYNHSPIIKGKGSAIFLHLSNKKYLPTSGCVALLKKDFIKILPLINNNTKISIR